MHYNTSLSSFFMRWIFFCLSRCISPNDPIVAHVPGKCGRIVLKVGNKAGHEFDILLYSFGDRLIFKPAFSSPVIVDAVDGQQDIVARGAEFRYPHHPAGNIVERVCRLLHLPLFCSLQPSIISPFSTNSLQGCCLRNPVSSLTLASFVPRCMSEIMTVLYKCLFAFMAPGIMQVNLYRCQGNHILRNCYYEQGKVNCWECRA